MRDGTLNLPALTAFVGKDGRSIRKLAAEARVTAGYLAKILRGEKVPSLAVALRIATVLTVPLAAFYVVDPALSSQIDVLEAGAIGAS